MYVDSSAFGRVKGGETGMYHVPLAVNVYMEEVKMVMELLNESGNAVRLNVKYLATLFNTRGRGLCIII